GRRAIEPDWIEFQKNLNMTGIGPPPLYDLVCPSVPDLAKRCAALASLAHTPGLAGVVVLDTEPSGYEQVDTHTTWGGFAPWLAVLHEFGYSESQRLTYLREHGVDPIDIPPSLFLGIDLRQPFFDDDNMSPMNSSQSGASRLMRGSLDQWIKYRSDLNSEAEIPL